MWEKVWERERRGKCVCVCESERDTQTHDCTDLTTGSVAHHCRQALKHPNRSDTSWEQWEDGLGRRDVYLFTPPPVEAESNSCWERNNWFGRLPCQEHLLVWQSHHHTPSDITHNVQIKGPPLTQVEWHTHTLTHNYHTQAGRETHKHTHKQTQQKFTLLHILMT